jgi:hypothetical protein
VNEGSERPLPAIHSRIGLLRCGPSFLTFAATVKSAGERIHSSRDKATLTTNKFETKRELSKLFGCAYIALCVSQTLLDGFVAGEYENLL